MLRAGGVRCHLVTDPALAEEPGDDAAVVVALRARFAPRDEAVADIVAAGKVLKARGARQLFYKYCATFDSTDDGNIGPAADALCDLMPSSLVLFTPSFPEAGRRVFQGHLFVDGQLVSESPKRHDPLAPMTDPNLVRVLQRQTTRKVGCLPFETVQAGPQAMRAFCRDLQKAGVAYAIADAAQPDDLDRIAELTADWPVATGNSSVAAYYPKLWKRSGWLRPEQYDDSRLHGVSGHGVVLAGSCADRTAMQLKAFSACRPVWTIDPQRLADGSDVVSPAVEWAVRMSGDGPVAIASFAGHEAVAALQCRLGKWESARLVEQTFGEIAVRLRRQGFRRFLVAGGETAGSVLEHLRVKRLRLGRYEKPGISQALSTGDDPLAFCLKGGKLGPADMFMDMLGRLEAGEP